MGRSIGVRRAESKWSVFIKLKRLGKAKLSYAVCTKSVSSNLILCEVCKCWVHKERFKIEGRLKQDGEFKY